MGLFDKMKNFAGGHGVTVTLVELDGAAVDGHSMDLDATSLRGAFLVQATKAEAVVLLHKVVLTARFSGAGAKRHVELGAFEEKATYSVSPNQPRTVNFDFSGIDLGQSMKGLGLGEHALVIDKRATLEVSVFVDVKGSPVDPSITHSVQVVDQEEVASVAAKAAVFSDRLHALVSALREMPGVEVTKATINPPCSPADISALHNRIGFPLSDAFLDYYRSANGALIEWTAGDEYGGIALRPLQEIDFGGGVFGDDFASAGERSLPFFGGADEHEVRSRLMEFDDAPKNQEYYPSAGLYAHATHATDPVVIFPSDAAACMTDAFPMRATSYLEMLLATAGDSQAIRDFPSAYGEKTWTIDWTRGDWDTIGGGANYVKWLQNRGDILANYAPAMSELQNLLRAGETSATIDPKRWIEQRFGVVYPNA